MELLELNATIRTKTGDGPARALRREGMIPAVIYGPNVGNKLLAVNMKELEQTLKTGQSGQLLYSLNIQNGDTIKQIAMIKELQKNPLTRDILHVDFYEISMDRKIRVKIPVVTKGKSVGVEKGGMLQIIRHELEVLCFPNKIPEVFEIDVSQMDFGDAVHVEDIPVDEEIEIIADTNFTVVTVTVPHMEEPEEGEEELEEGEEEQTGESDASDEGEEE